MTFHNPGGSWDYRKNHSIPARSLRCCTIHQFLRNLIPSGGVITDAA